MADLKNNTCHPVWESEKANSLIEGYQLFFNQTKSHMKIGRWVWSLPIKRIMKGRPLGRL